MIRCFLAVFTAILIHATATGADLSGTVFDLPDAGGRSLAESGRQI